MNKIYYCKITENSLSLGLCNQFFCLVTGIITAYKMGKKIIIVDHFSNDYLQHIPISFSEVIDIKSLQQFLKKEYDLFLVEKNNLDFQVNTVVYGQDNQWIDITEKVILKYTLNDTLYINTQVDLNKLAERDPCPNRQKKIKISYSFHGNMIEEEFDEYGCVLKKNVLFDVSQTPFIHTFGWINKIDRIMFDKILHELYPATSFIKEANIFCNEKQINPYSRINVLHLRLEKDAIMHWSHMNNMNPYLFQQIISNKYIQLIKKYVDKSDHNIILSYSTNNVVCDFLKQNGYIYYFTNKSKDKGREMNAWIDLNIGKLANHLFIGNFNLEKLTGSTLSYCLSNYYDKSVKKIMIDLDNITHNEQVVN